MQIKKNANDVLDSTSDHSPLSFSARDDGKKPENGPQVVSRDTVEAREGSTAEKKNPQAQGFRGGKDARSSVSQGSPTSGSKEWAQENVNKGPKTHKNRYW